jgi:hypothetical protein
VETAYTINVLSQGQTYQIKVEARNIYGYSAFSNVVSILTAQVPAKPTVPTTTWSTPTDSVVVEWTAPDNGGSAITGYQVLLRQSDSQTYAVEAFYCNMAT